MCSSLPNHQACQSPGQCQTLGWRGVGFRTCFCFKRCGYYSHLGQSEQGKPPVPTSRGLGYNIHNNCYNLWADVDIITSSKQVISWFFFDGSQIWIWDTFFWSMTLMLGRMLDLYSRWFYLTKHVKLGLWENVSVHSFLAKALIFCLALRDIIALFMLFCVCLICWELNESCNQSCLLFHRVK